MHREIGKLTSSQKITFHFERVVARGPLYRVLLLWVLLVLIALVGGALAYVIPAGGFDRLSSAVWWAFLHLSDPGYLGEDRAPGIRFLGLALTMLGMAVVIGALIAIITQWFSDMMDRLALGMTPIRANGHVVILGWTNRSLELVASLLDARGAGRVSRVALMVQRITPEIVQEIRDRIGAGPMQSGRLILRSGDPRQIDQMIRVDPRHCRAVVVPADVGSSGRDVDTLKVVANLGAIVFPGDTSSPQLTAELCESTMIEVVRATYPAASQTFSSQAIIGRALGLEAVSPGLSFVLTDLFDTRHGCTIRIEKLTQLDGETIQGAARRLPNAVLMGVLRATDSENPYLQSRFDTVLKKDDSLVLLAQIDEEIVPQTARLVEQTGIDSPAISIPDGVVLRRVLILGWNDHVPHILVELARHRTLDCRVDIVARTSVETRTNALEKLDGHVPVAIRHLIEDPVLPQTYRGLQLETYDAVVIVAIGAAESDNIAAYLLLEHALGESTSRPYVVVETHDAGTSALLAARSIQVINSPVLVAEMLAGTVTHPGLFPVLDRMLEAKFGMVRTLDLQSLIRGAGDVDLLALEAQLRKQGLVLMGHRPAGTGEKVTIAPDKRKKLGVRPGDQLIAFELASSE